MPRRTRAHELEALSRSAMRACLPPGWVVRDVHQDDYGVDQQVEIFDDGLATGLMFHVQLKATDEPSLELGDTALERRCPVRRSRPL